MPCVLKAGNPLLVPEIFERGPYSEALGTAISILTILIVVDW